VIIFVTLLLDRFHKLAAAKSTRSTLSPECGRGAANEHYDLVEDVDAKETQAPGYSMSGVQCSAGVLRLRLLNTGEGIRE
jgi:hypothetical protein